LSSTTLPPSQDLLREDNDLASRRSRLTSAASDCTSNGDMDKVGPDSCRCLISSMLLFQQGVAVGGWRHATCACSGTRLQFR
jgi:hypothetical protein